ncbi:MAG: YgiT-type zinc finger protein [Jatrophihabitans sp.]
MADNEEFYCVNCSGETVVVLRPYAVERNGKLVVVRDVPMHECDECGETYLTPAVMKQLDGLVADLLAGNADQAIIRYPVAA